ncbi:hypothetical protein [Paramagnetospirillum magnetotacticum]|uniref:hypothetical protein n=1 Tax=Paramagnetospirillum magnetotacticum TaxID=188 RepID=UPI001364C5B2|nr:hypothetical protein [Paramagnetospirillum magnetotacticum]
MSHQLDNDQGATHPAADSIRQGEATFRQKNVWPISEFGWGLTGHATAMHVH